MVHNRSGNYQPSQWHLLVLSSSSQIRRGPDVTAAAAAAGTCARQLCFFIAMMHFTERTASHRSLHRGFSRSSWSSVRNHQRYVHRSRDWTAHGPNREGPRLDYRRIPPPLRSPMIPPTRISSLTSRFENFCTPLGNFPPSSAFDRFRPYQLSSSFLSLSTLAAISIYSCSSFPPPLPYLPPNANAAPFVPPRLIFYNFIERCWHRIVERDRPRRFTRERGALSLEFFFPLWITLSEGMAHPVKLPFLHSEQNGRLDGWRSVFRHSPRKYFSMKFCEIEIELELEGWSRGSYGGEDLRRPWKQCA